MRIVKIYKSELSTKSQCVLMNGISVISHTTFNTMESLLSDGNFPIFIMILDGYDPFAD